MREIALSNGGCALVDDDAPSAVFKMSWCWIDYSNFRYARARFRKSLGGDGRIVSMHRFIMAAPAGFVVDHINGSGLDNRRSNLQITTQSRNIMRSLKRRGGVSKHRGDKWRARLRVDGRAISLGCFNSKEAAQEAVEAARKTAWEDHRINVLGTVL